MGQKTEFNLDDWEFQEEISAKQEKTDTSVSVQIDSDFEGFGLDVEPLAANKEPLAANPEPNNTQDTLEQKGIFISKKDADGPVSIQEEEAFRKQIEDLFELLELEKAADKNDGIRVYQTDSSPSRPWRFH